MAVQELGFEAAREIDARYEISDLDPRKGAHGMGLAATRPVTFGRVPLPHVDGWAATLRPEEWPGLGGAVRVLSVHFRNPINLPPARVHRERRQQVQALVDMGEADSGNTLLVGDFNATPAWPAYRRIAEVYDDGVRALQGRATRRTWGPRTLFGLRLLRIDHVFTRGVDVTKVAVVRIPGSDHAAVVADCEVAT